MGFNGITSVAMALIAELVNSVQHGTITLVVQDARLIQLDRNDSIRLDTANKVSRSILNSKQSERLYQKLHEELKDLQFGQVILSVRNGLIMQIERVEKQRLLGLEGIYGDGI